MDGVLSKGISVRVQLNKGHAKHSEGERRVKKQAAPYAVPTTLLQQLYSPLLSGKIHAASPSCSVGACDGTRDAKVVSDK
jgi:hypothetical protein